VLNTDAVEFGGSGVSNLEILMADEIVWQGQPCSIELTLPPLGVLWLVPADQATGGSGEV
jgi:1,4-alpha-glucan branching enzyme